MQCNVPIYSPYWILATGIYSFMSSFYHGYDRIGKADGDVLKDIMTFNANRPTYLKLGDSPQEGGL